MHTIIFIYFFILVDIHQLSIMKLPILIQVISPIFAFFEDHYVQANTFFLKK